LAVRVAAAEAGGAIESAEFVNDPMPTPQCHASTVAEVPGGLVAAWFGGTKEGSPDVAVWLARQEGGAWSPAREVANGVQSETLRYPCWNPVLFPAPDGSLVLFYKVGPDCTWWWGERRVSRDHGRTWSQPQRLPNGMIGPIKNKPLALADGRVLCGASSEFGPWLVHVETTDAACSTWSRTGPLHGRSVNAIQPSFLAHPGGALQMVGRTKEKRVFSIFSKDGGRTWGELSLLDLPNPNAGTDALTLKDGRHLIVYNPVEKGRSPLSVALSADGVSWRRVLDLETQEKCEFSYPAVIQGADGKVHITYTWKRLKVSHVVLDAKKLDAGAEKAE
jgi:predicted neuraminidase